MDTGRRSNPSKLLVALVVAAAFQSNTIAQITGKQKLWRHEKTGLSISIPENFHVLNEAGRIAVAKKLKQKNTPILVIQNRESRVFVQDWDWPRSTENFAKTLQGVLAANPPPRAVVGKVISVKLGGRTFYKFDVEHNVKGVSVDQSYLYTAGKEQKVISLNLSSIKDVSNLLPIVSSIKFDHEEKVVPVKEDLMSFLSRNQSPSKSARTSKEFVQQRGLKRYKLLKDGAVLLLPNGRAQKPLVLVQSSDKKGGSKFVLGTSLATLPNDTSDFLDRVLFVNKRSRTIENFNVTYSVVNGRVAITTAFSDKNVDAATFRSLVTKMQQVIEKEERIWNPKMWSLPRHVGTWETDSNDESTKLVLRNNGQFVFTQNSSNSKVRAQGSFRLETDTLFLRDATSGKEFNAKVFFLDGNTMEFESNGQSVVFTRR